MEQKGGTHLEHHTNTNEEKGPGIVLHILHLGQPSTDSAIRVVSGPSWLRVDKLPLHLGDMQESQVGRMEQGNPQREVDPHAKVLDVIGKHHPKCASHGICDLTQDPVDM